MVIVFAIVLDILEMINSELDRRYQAISLSEI